MATLLKATWLVSKKPKIKKNLKTNGTFKNQQVLLVNWLQLRFKLLLKIIRYQKLERECYFKIKFKEKRKSLQKDVYKDYKNIVRFIN